MNLNKIPAWAGWLLVSLVVALAGVTVVVATDDSGTRTVTISRTHTVAAAPTPKAIAEAPPSGELQSDPADVKELRDPTPAGVPAEKLKDAKETADAIADQTQVPDAGSPLPVAGAQGYSCRKSFQSSSSYGAFRSYFLMFDLHYTVSPNVKGWADVYNIKRYLNSVGLSATYIMDFEGHCLQTVPLDHNPYTQGSFNQYGASVEIIATGKETRAEWLRAPLIKRGILAALVRETLLSHKLPLRFVDPVSCTPKTGYTDHNHLECGNNHVDVSPNFPFDVFARQVRTSPCSAHCRRAHALRAKHKRTHDRFRKNKCSVKGVIRHGYCDTLRARNKAVHAAAKRDHVSLKGTF